MNQFVPESVYQLGDKKNNKLATNGQGKFWKWNRWSYTKKKKLGVKKIHYYVK